MTRETVWVLDLNYDFLDDQPVVWIWSRTAQDEPRLLLDRRYRPAFYLLVEPDADVAEVLERLQPEIEKRPELLGATPVQRGYLNRPVTAIRVETRATDAAQMRRLAERLARIPGIQQAAESDIRWSVQYLLETGLSPSSWWQVETRPAPPNHGYAQVPWTIAEITDLQAGPDDPPPDLRFAAWAMMPWQAEGIMNPETDPIVCLGLTDGTDRKVWTGVDEKVLLQAFLETLQRWDPDILWSYGANRWDWNYLLTRCRVHDLEPAVGRDGTPPHTSLYGHISITGRCHIDLLDFAEDLEMVKVKTLASVARYLGLTSVRDDWDDWTWARTWKDHRDRAEAWFRDRLRAIYDLGQEFWHYALGLSQLTGIPLDHVGAAAAGFRVEAFLMRAARHINELIPERRDIPYRPYEGGFVLQPEVGLHRDIAVLDFKSMYPSIMIRYNISPDTMVPEGVPLEPDQTYQAPTVGHRFRKQPDGIYRKILQRLIATRQKIKRELAQADLTESQRKILQANEKAIKVITNAVYGYAGWPGARWYAKPVAEATADWGRWIIQQTIQKARQLGLDVIYGDTDSVFVRHDGRAIAELARYVEDEFGMTLELERIYQKILFTEAKKRYAGVTQEGHIDVVGLEVVRGDWARIAQKVQYAVLEAILVRDSVDEAVARVQEAIEDLRSGRVDRSDLVIWKSLTRRLEDYKANAPHIEAGRQLLSRGYRLTVGQKVGYVIVRGTGPLYKRARPFFLVQPEEIDYAYYIEKQVRPAAERILAVVQPTPDQA